jgi:hypothetical protein
MQIFKGQQFEDRSFSLEETVFHDCQLKKCHLFYSGGDVEMTNTNIENCQFHWRGPAKNTVWLLQLLGMLRTSKEQQIPGQLNISGLTN